MIREYQKQFIRTAVITVTIILAVTLALVNIANLGRAYLSSFDTAQLILDNGGEIGDQDSTQAEEEDPEFRYQTRFFSVRVTGGGNVVPVDISHIASVNFRTAQKLAERLEENGRRTGFFHRKGTHFVYKMKPLKDGGKLYVFVDCSRETDNAIRFMLYSAFFGVICIILFWLVMRKRSEKMILPIIRNERSQRQFITNASHELKTPVSIISADAEVLKMTGEDNEWVASIRNQTKRLTGLINNLVELSRISENQEPEIRDFDLSSDAAEIASSFEPVFREKEKSLEQEIPPEIRARADERAIREVIHILLDNASKYCDADGLTRIALEQKKSSVILTASNDYAGGAKEDYRKFFDRFYRADESHTSSSTVSGYGIGLSMAKGLVEKSGGKISASWKDGRIFFRVELPAGTKGEASGS